MGKLARKAHTIVKNKTLNLDTFLKELKTTVRLVCVNDYFKVQVYCEELVVWLMTITTQGGDH